MRLENGGQKNGANQLRRQEGVSSLERVMAFCNGNAMIVYIRHDTIRCERAKESVRKETDPS